MIVKGITLKRFEGDNEKPHKCLQIVYVTFLNSYAILFSAEIAKPHFSGDGPNIRAKYSDIRVSKYGMRCVAKNLTPHCGDAPN